MNNLFTGQGQPDLVTFGQIDTTFRRIVVEEARRREPNIPPECGIFTDPHVARQIVYYLYEVAKSSFVIRGYNPKYGISEPNAQAYESVGAHTNLVLAITDCALRYIYDGSIPNETEGGFTYQDIMETIRIHDLPENKIGDICDDGSHDEAQKHQDEEQYLAEFNKNYPIWAHSLGANARTLFGEMRPDTKSPTGLLLFLADKTAALLVALLLDDTSDSPPMLSKNDPNASERDRAELELCDSLFDGEFGLMSEMWTVDFFNIRNFAKRDHSGFFTAIIVMATLLIHGRWYNWRENDYLAFAETEGEG